MHWRAGGSAIVGGENDSSHLDTAIVGILLTALHPVE
jgi:hypothetical protein